MPTFRRSLAGATVPIVTLVLNVVVALLFPIVIAVAVDVPMAMVLELSITSGPLPDTPVPLIVVAAVARPAQSAKAPTTITALSAKRRDPTNSFEII